MTCIHRNPAPCLLCAFVATFNRAPQTPTLRVLTADEQRAEDQAHERAEDKARDLFVDRGEGLRRQSRYDAGVEGWGA